MELPALAEVPALVDPAVGAHHQVVRVVGIELQVVVVHVLPAAVDLAPRRAVVVGDVGPHVHRVDPAGPVRVWKDLHVVLRVHADVVAALLPALAAVGGAVEAARVVGGGDQGVDDVGVVGRDGESDAADVVPVGGGEALRELPPGRAAVLGLVDAALRAARDQEAGVPAPLPRRGVEDVGVPGIQHHVADPGVLGDVEHPLPGGAAVDRLVEAAVSAGPPQRPLRRDEDGVAVARVDHDLADVLRLVEPQVLEGSSGVAAPPDPVAVAHRALAVVLAGAEPEHVGIRGIDHDRRGRIHRVVLEDRLPGGSPVRGLEGVPGGDRNVPSRPVVRVDRYVGDAAGAGGGADFPELQAGEQVLGDRRRFLGARCRGGQEGGGEREAGERTVAHGEISYGRYRVVGSDIMEAQG